MYIESCNDHCYHTPIFDESEIFSDEYNSYVNYVEIDGRSVDEFGTCYPESARTTFFEMCPQCGHVIEVVVIS